MKRTFFALVLPALLLVGAGCFGKPAAPSATAPSAVGPAGTGPDAAAPAPQPSGTAPSGTNAPAPAPRTSVTISLRSVSDDKEWGSATLTGMGNQTVVSLTLVNAPRNEAQSAAIYKGSCAELKTDVSAEPQYPLAPVVKGKSTTTLNVNLSSLLDKTPQSIRVKMDSIDGSEPLAACGNLL